LVVFAAHAVVLNGIANLTRLVLLTMVFAEHQKLMSDHRVDICQR